MGDLREAARALLDDVRPGWREDMRQTVAQSRVDALRAALKESDATQGVMEEIADLKRRLAAFGSEPAGWQVVSALGVAVDIRDSSASAHFRMDRLNESRIDGRPYTVCPVYRGPA